MSRPAGGRARRIPLAAARAAAARAAEETAMEVPEPSPPPPEEAAPEPVAPPPATNHPAPSLAPRGVIEGSSEGSIWGWAHDPLRPHEPVSVELWDDAQLILRMRADIWRPDIEADGKLGRLCGFNLPLPQHLLTGHRHILHLRIAGQDTDLQGSPLIVEADRPPISWEDYLALLPRVEAAAERATSPAAMRDLLGPVLGTLGTLLPRYLAVAEQAGEDRTEAFLDLAFSYSDRIGEIVQDFTRRYPRLNYPDAPEPLVSVVIPVYGKFAYTYQCLVSILGALPRVPFEVIVVDDCSPDETMFMASIAGGGLRYLRSPRNGGFIFSCNNGAAAARGRYVLFLNNDTEVREGWLDTLVETFEQFPEAGLVGSKLVFPDGSVQEAGGIIWKLGDGWNYGRGAQADDPRISYLREVDYVSGAAIMIPKPLLDELGGFDTHYSPAYYEDTDLAFRVRKAGKRVFYQPASVVVHYEGITSGTDVQGTGVKRYQLVNGRKFFDRWRDTLASHRLNGREPELEKERRVSRRILFIDETTPTPQEDAGSVAAISHMRAMQRLGAKITFVPADNMAHLGEITTALQKIGIEVLHAPWYWSAEEVVRKRGGEFDAVYLHRYVNAFKYAGVLRAAMPRAKLLYSVADLHHLRLEREAAVTGSSEIAQKAAELKVRELTALGMVDQVIVHSAHEGNYLAGMLDESHLNIIPWVVPTRIPATPFADRRDVVFLGGYRHPPNVDAVMFFVLEVMPHLRQLLPGVVFRIAGSHMPDSFHDLAASDVVLDGFIPDLSAYFENIRVMVAPLRYGAGVKGKVFESLARGLPCVASSVAAEGMGLLRDEEVAVADDAQAIAESIAWIYQDEAAWNRLQQGGLDYIARNCSEQAVTARFATLFARLDAG